ncbi:pyridoxal phosphate-dependent aminotransferase [Fervidicoccus fontis]|uniref:Aminotransferase n=2 Tax=Fervidicoccus fontis TaxID=683846 RepID=I0A1L8_FERFK|nr:pyridoxal phosphate-dependent aminotransferase [Fervidicoccus fontis]AFH42875.1 aminotransferase [Fervidicoccus fontis Kam940]MBE9391782.1 pyridoxal phosphate-dependent aminotransferase [Fervidicoccus fontis]
MRKISSRSQKISPSLHRLISNKMDELKRKGVETYNFTQGQPGFPPDENIIKATFEHALKNSFDHYRYLPTQGLPELRTDISDELKESGGISIDPSNIVVTSGGIEALHLTFYATTDPGDRAFFLDPTYSVYWDIANMYNLKVDSCEQNGEDFQPDPECLKEKINRNTSLILVTSPDNPTSRILSEDIFKLIADLAVDNDVWLLYDEAYRNIIYEGKHVWIQKYSRTLEKLVGLDTFSKDLAIPGLRLGYLYAENKDLIKEVLKLKGIVSISSDSSAQWMAHIALSSGMLKIYLSKVIPKYRSRRDAAYETIREFLPEAKVTKPIAGMYLFPDLSPYLSKKGMDDTSFAIKLSEEKGVGVLPGSIFGKAGKGHVRITFVTMQEERIKKGIKLMSEFLTA